VLEGEEGEETCGRVCFVKWAKKMMDVPCTAFASLYDRGTPPRACNLTGVSVAKLSVATAPRTVAWGQT
jgi:hypothetical protein